MISSEGRFGDFREPALAEFRLIEDAVLASNHPVMELTRRMLVDVLKAQYASVVDPEGESDGLD